MSKETRSFDFIMIEKVKEVYGEEKGSLLLSYLNTYLNELQPYVKFGMEEEFKALSEKMSRNLFSEYGQDRVSECTNFLVINHDNEKLRQELLQTGDEYVLPEVLLAKKMCKFFMTYEKLLDQGSNCYIPDFVEDELKTLRKD